MALLEVRQLESAYGESRVLFGLSLDVLRGEVVALLGRNGAGKTTTLASIMGLVKPRAGSIPFEGAEIAAASLSKPVAPASASLPRTVAFSVA